jgi:hypothetical protein
MSSSSFSISLIFVSLSSAQNGVFDIAKLLHVGLEVGLVSVPTNVADKESRLVLCLSLRSSFSFLVLVDPGVFLRFFLSISLVSELLLEISSLLILILLLDLSVDNLLVIHVSVLRNMLDLKLVRVLTESELYSNVSSLEVLSIAFSDNFMGLLSRGELDEPKTSILIVLRVERNVDGVDGHILHLAEVSLELLVPHIEGQVTHDEPTLMLSSVFFWSVGILFHNYLF